MVRILRRNARWSAIIWADRSPCFQFVRRHISRHSGVVGPVLAPPCSRQRVYRPVLVLHIAGARHSLPDLVLAPQRGLEEGSPLQDGPFRLFRCSETGATLCMGSVVNLANIAMRTRAFRPALDAKWLAHDYIRLTPIGRHSVTLNKIRSTTSAAQLVTCRAAGELRELHSRAFARWQEATKIEGGRTARRQMGGRACEMNARTRC
jgi:hypothetical protein